MVKDSVTQTADIGISVTKQNSIEIKELEIYALNKETNDITTYSLNKNEISTNDYGTKTTYYVYTDKKDEWNNFVFLIVYTDNFGRENHILASYLDISFDRYEGSADLTENMQSLSSILVSSKDSIYFNEKIDSEVAINIITDNGTSSVSSIYELNEDRIIKKDGYYSYKLEAVPVNESNSSFLGGMVKYEIIVKENLSDFDDVYDSDETDAKKVYNVIIYNQIPKITLRNAKGEDITQALFNKTQTHSGKLFISYESLENMGYTSVVMLRKRGSNEGYVEIPTSYSISEAGTYDIKIFNRNPNGSLAYSYEKQFIIANYDVNFYSVVAYDANNTDNPYRIIEPTGKIFECNGEKINYHYIINTSTYEISVNNGVVAELLSTKNEVQYTNYIYEIKSQTLDAGSSIKFSRKIAITVLNANNDILVNSLEYYLGNKPGEVAENLITKSTTDIYIYNADEFDFVTVQWNSYYILPANKIFYQISNDGGKTFSEKIESGDELTTKISLTKSGNYVLIFTDLAGNVQTITDLDNGVNFGVKDRYNINFIKSVIFLVNDENPIDNAVYNENVTISIPSSTISYYEDKPAPTIHVERNGEEYNLSNNKLKTYEFTESGRYVIYFTATKAGNEIGIEKYTFTIINPNDSRWAFSYQNYNGYIIDYIKYNGTDFDLSSVLVNDEVIMSVIGDNGLDSGIYRIKMSTTSVPVQSFEFDVWLNNTTPSIVVSIPEGTTTTGDVELKFNTINLYDKVGDCVIMVNDEELLRINSEYFESEDFTENFIGKMSETGVYYIQVYTSSDKLIYSYKVEIVDPLNTVTIILIVVGCVAVVVGVVLFLLLRKKLRIR